MASRRGSLLSCSRHGCDGLWGMRHAVIGRSSPYPVNHPLNNNRLALPRKLAWELKRQPIRNATRVHAHEQKARLPRLCGDHSGGSARRAEDDSLSDRTFRQPGQPLPCLRLAHGRGRGSRARAGGPPGQLRSEGDRLDLRRHRIETIWPSRARRNSTASAAST